MEGTGRKVGRAREVSRLAQNDKWTRCLETSSESVSGAHEVQILSSSKFQNLDVIGESFNPLSPN